MISRDRKPTPAVALGVLLPETEPLDPHAPNFPLLAFLRGEKRGFLWQWEGAAQPAAVGAPVTQPAGGGVYEQPKWL